MSTSLVCPKCKEIDMVRKVSSVVSGGTSVGRYAGPTAGASINLGTRRTSVSSYYTNLTGSSWTAISARLTPPLQPTYKSVFGIYFGIGIGVIALSFLLVIPWLMTVLFPSRFTIIEWLLYLLFIMTATGVTVGAILIIVGIIREKKNKEEANNAIPGWVRALQRWDRLYYCARDDGVFIPEEGIFVPTPRMVEYIYRGSIF